MEVGISHEAGLPCQNFLGVRYDRALFVLTEYYVETGARYSAGDDHIRKDVSSSNRRELVRVSNKDNPGVFRKPGQQDCADVLVCHRSLVDDEQVAVNRIERDRFHGGG